MQGVDTGNLDHFGLCSLVSCALMLAAGAETVEEFVRTLVPTVTEIEQHTVPVVIISHHSTLKVCPVHHIVFCIASD